MKKPKLVNGPGMRHAFTAGIRNLLILVLITFPGLSPIFHRFQDSHLAPVKVLTPLH